MFCSPASFPHCGKEQMNLLKKNCHLGNFLRKKNFQPYFCGHRNIFLKKFPGVFFLFPGFCNFCFTLHTFETAFFISFVLLQQTSAVTTTIATTTATMTAATITRTVMATATATTTTPTTMATITTTTKST